MFNQYIRDHTVLSQDAGMGVIICFLLIMIFMIALALRIALRDPVKQQRKKNKVVFDDDRQQPVAQDPRDREIEFISKTF